MKKLLLTALSIALIAGSYIFFSKHAQARTVDYTNFTVEDIPYIFPKTPGELNSLINDSMPKMKQAVATILAIPDNDRTWENTIYALEKAGYFFSIPSAIASVIKSTSSDEKMRETAREKLLEVSDFSIDLLGQNVELYNAIKAYYEGNAKKENLSKDQQYFLDEMMKDYKRSGIDKPLEIREQIKKINKELSEISLAFSKNVDGSQRSIEVTREELAGLDDRFIEGLEKTGDNTYKLTTAYPIYFPVIENATLAATREKLWREFVQRAYPENMEVLKKLIAKRDELAKLLGYQTYAALNIDGEMAETPERAQAFLDDLGKRAQVKEDKEFKQLSSDLPELVKLSPNNKFYPWDRAHAQAVYEKKHFNIDQRKIAEYFPLESTIKGLLDIYRAFLGVDFKELPAGEYWDPEIKLVEVSSRETGAILGYLLLDLHPRFNKYCHACQMTVIPGLISPEGKRQPALAVVLSNFPKATATEPSLLELDDVRTFFHEFGHALHTILGATKLPSTSGTNVKTDFVEMPSQMLEEWLWDPAILKQLSKHYKTGAPLPDELIKTLVEQKNFSSGAANMRQIYIANLALKLFSSGPDPDIENVTKSLFEKMRKYSEYSPDDHFVAAFGHLTGYGARYYGYLWSKVFALDLFNYIKERGLLDSEVGKRYVDKVLGKGGSADPNELLKDFLGREPNSNAFFKDLGL
ncbi:MAG TPA: M3 family metallopeptidase [Candidatus Babeliales bacterium]|nr:M3 family metallopeptidase [Candidatus Babeliales bacterium]